MSSFYEYVAISQEIVECLKLGRYGMAMHEPFNASAWLLDRHIDEGRGNRTAVLCGDEEISYQTLHQRVEQVAAALRGAGVRAEERVALAVLDSVENVLLFLGAMRIGAVPLAMNPLLPGRDLGVITADGRARVAFISGSLLEGDRADTLDALRAGAPELETVVPIGGEEWAAFLAGGEGHSGACHLTWAESPGFWLCTSGSTGQPKLAMHRHGDLPVTVENYASQVLGVTEDDVCFSVGPMFHAYGLGNSMTFPLAMGARTVLEPTRPPTPARVAELVERHSVTLFFCIPTFYAALNASDLPDDAFGSVRFGVSAAEALPPETFHRFRDRFGVTILDGIGSTEMLHIYLSNQPAKAKPGTSGVPVPGYEIRLLVDDGSEAPAGEPGQLLVRGESMATGYWCRSDQSRATFEGDWMRTGDLYSCDDEGFYAYLGRVDDMLRVGGEWVSPAEVEGVLMEHDAVLEAAIVGAVDDTGVLRPVAHVIPAAQADTNGLEGELTAHCRERLAGYKRPRTYVFTAELPKTVTGKIQRFKLRD